MSEVLNFGCRLNAYESEIIRGLTAGLPGTVINGCAVTAEAERQARQTIRRLARANPGAPITVTGCAAQIAPARWSTLPGVTRVVGNTEKLQATTWQSGSKAAVADIITANAPLPSGIHAFAGRARALVQIQQGCDHHCTFCVIPLGRGRNRSVPENAIVDTLKTLADAGYHEAVLTGVDVTSYGRDLPDQPALGSLVRKILVEVPKLARLRLSSLDPAAIDEDLWHAIAAEPRLMPHLHLSLQSASAMVLKRMRRRHTPGQAADIIARARALRPGIAIGADLIAGFPSETDAQAEETRSWVERHALPYLHVFPYSERPETPAARMPQVLHDIRKTRAAALRAQAATNAQRWHQATVGTVVEILTEAGPTSHTEHFAPVRLTTPHLPGQRVRAKILAADASALTAERI